MKRRRTAAEVLATFYSMDMAEMSEYRYQPTRFANPAIYTIGGTGYAAAPASGKMPPNYCDLKWKRAGEMFGRPIFIGFDDSDEGDT
jgi:hypothetical protein